MRNSQRFFFTKGLDVFGIPDALSNLPLTLTYQDSSVNISGLLNTGASVNVMPYMGYFLEMKRLTLAVDDRMIKRLVASSGFKL